MRKFRSEKKEKEKGKRKIPLIISAGFLMLLIDNS